MCNKVNWQKMAFLLDGYPVNSYKSFPALIDKLANKLNDVKRNAVKAKNVFTEMINLHRVAYVLSIVHEFDSNKIISSYEYWIEYGKDLELNLGQTCLPTEHDLLYCKKSDIEDLLLKSFNLFPDHDESLSVKVKLVAKLEEMGWGKIANDIKQVVKQQFMEDMKIIGSMRRKVRKRLKDESVFDIKLINTLENTLHHGIPSQKELI